jgi:hypothetical protein
MPVGGSGPFRVSHLPRVTRQIQALLQLATQKGIDSEVRQVFAGIYHRLQTSPSEWGDPLYPTKLPGGVVYHAMERPLNIHYAVYEAQRQVFILDIDPLAGGPLAGV